MSASATLPALDVLDADGLHVPDKALVPVADVIRFGGDLCPAAWWLGREGSA